MNNQRVIYWIKEIVGFLILNKDLLRAYLNNYEGVITKELISKLAKNFVAQNFARILGDYITRKIDNRVKSMKSSITSGWNNIMSMFQSKSCLA